MSLSRIEIYTGWKCSNRCLFCNEEYQKRKNNNRIIPYEEIRKTLIEEKKNGANHVTFLGGEPFIHPKFDEILAYAKSLNYKTLVTTNTVLLHNENLAKNTLPMIDELILSLLGGRKEIHNKCVQNKKAFQAIEKSLKNIKKYFKGSLLKVNTVVNTHNFKYLKELIDFIKQNNIRNIAFVNPDPNGNAKDNFFKIVPKLSEIKKDLSDAISYASQENIRIRLEGFPLCVLEEHKFKSDDLFYSNRVKIEDDLERKDRKIHPPRKRIQTERCSKCIYKDVCQGIYTYYFEQYGDLELNPIINK